MTNEHKTDSTGCDDEMKGDLEIDEMPDSLEQSISSRSGKGTPPPKEDMDVKSPASSNDLKIDESVDDIEEDNVENTTPGAAISEKKRGRPPKSGTERKRRTRKKDANAPKAPINGYVRFLSENRERCRKDNPEVAFASITKILAQEWSKLQHDEKQRYLDAAEKDRERYNKELEDYHQTDSYKQFKKQVQEEEAAKQRATQEFKESEKKRQKTSDKQPKMNSANTLRPSNQIEEMMVPPPSSPHIPMPVANIRHNSDDTFDIPIFTEEFLDHNKVREADLRQLRKTNADLEEQNAVLTKHIDSFKDAIGKLECEAEQHRNSNKQMELYLAKLRGRLVDSFQQVTFPGWETKVSVENIDQFMEGLLHFMKDSPKEQENVLDNIKSIINSIDCSDL